MSNLTGTLEERLEGIISALILMIADPELGKFVDKEAVKKSAIEQILESVEETKDDQP